MSDAVERSTSYASRWDCFPRRRIDELMDAPAVPLRQHQLALAGLRRINAVSRVVHVLADHITRFARQRQLTRIRLLDVACGGGDVPVGVARTLQRRGIPTEIMLVDRSDTALHQAASLAREHGVSARTSAADALHTLPESAFDVVTNTLFLHHLDDDDVISALRTMQSRGKLLLISDLRRSAVGWAFAWAGCRLLSRSPIVHFDGPVSVRAAWTIEEMRRFAESAGLGNTTITRQWPFRMLLRSESP